CGGDAQAVHHVVTAQLRPAHALAATVLGTVVVGAGALGVPAAGDGDDHVLFGDEVLDGHIAVVGQDRGTALITVLVHHLLQLIAHDLALAFGLGQNVTVVGDLGFQGRELVQD